jgi:hypothetical protein
MSDAFAEAYDTLGLAHAGCALARVALGAARERGLHPRQAAVLGCASGSAALDLARAGLEVLGLVEDAALLRRARQKARVAGLEACWRAVSLAEGKEPPGELGAFREGCELVLVPEGVGRLRQPDMLVALLALAAELLDRPGLLAFDVPAPPAAPADRVLRNDERCLAYVRPAVDWGGQRLETRLVCFVCEGRLWRRAEHIRVERLWRAEELEAALHEAGLALLCRRAGDGALAERQIYLAERR